MTDRIVVCFKSPEFLIEAADYLGNAHSLVERAAALGGRLASWGATMHAFELDGEAIQDAVELALSVCRDAPAGREYGVGISVGALAHSEEAAARVTLTWGYPLVSATALARAARPGEVLVDPALGPVKRGELLTVGSRVGTYGKQRLRGLLLDVKHPFRTSLAETVAGLLRPAIVGRNDIIEFELPPGSLAVVRAARGGGGSRYLEGLERGLEPARILRVSPHPFGEPLGALRRALLRAVTAGQAPLNLGESAGRALDALLAGEGLDADSSAELLSAWLAPEAIHDPNGAIVIDDATEVDADTLEVVERAASSGASFRILIRITDRETAPAALANLPVASQFRIEPLLEEDATALAAACTGGPIEEAAAQRWATRGGRLPLGIVEAIRDAFESGEIVSDEGQVISRLKSPPPGASRAPKHWVRRRLSHQEVGGRYVLQALSILGGEAESPDLLDLLARKDEAFTDAGSAIAVLVAAGWIQRVKPDVLALPTATHRDAVLSTMEDEEFQRWHGAACEVYARRERPLAASAAAVHAVLAGDTERAVSLSRKAAAATRALGLVRTAAAFERFAEHGDLGALADRNLFKSQLEMARAVPSVWPEARASVAPPPPSERTSQPPSAPMVVPPVTPPVAPPVVPQVVPPPPEHVFESAADSHPARSEPSSAAVEALRKGDLEAVERLAEQGLDEGKSALAERLRAMAHLARGETGDAIRKLRDSVEEARRTGSRDRCRASLALGVALAAASRHEEALLEALDALARARESSDTKGERACLRFLGQLSSTVGHHDVAEAWATLAEQ